MSWRLVSLGVGLAIGVASFSGCDFLVDAALSEAEEMSEKELVKLEDQRVESALSGKSEENEVCVPMTEFFANPQKYKLWAGDPAAFKSLGEKCVAAGAPATYAIVNQEDEVQVTDSFAIALPVDKAARTKVIEVYNQFWKDTFKVPEKSPTGGESEETEFLREEMESYLAKDIGQKYITFSYDD